MNFLLFALVACLALVGSSLAAGCAGKPDDSECTASTHDYPGICRGGVCSFNCGNGQVERALGEQCDPPNLECCNRQCRFIIGVQCRAANGTCDVAESCNGRHHYCPQDVFKADDTFCPLPGHIHPGVCRKGQCVKPHEKDEFFDDVIVHRHYHHGKHSDAVKAAQADKPAQ